MSHDNKSDRFSINDPIHGLMQFRNEAASLVKKITDTALFQRLRYIKQMGSAFLVYPGATHNRLSHSLGAAYLAYRVAQKLEKEEKEISADTILCLTAMALLHDIGHGPYSHAFEGVNFKPDPNSKNEIHYSHEKMGSRLVNKLISEENAFDSDQKEILRIVNRMMNAGKNKTSPNAKDPREILVKTLISSQLDIDRMDYLLRDSHFCGVSYGVHDHKWLIHSIKTSKCNGSFFVGIDRKAIGSAEQFLMARRLLITRVCKHHKVVAAEHLVVSFIQELYDNLECLPKNNIFEALHFIEFLRNIKTHARNDNNEFPYSETMGSFEKISDIELEMTIKLVAESADMDENKLSACKKIANKILGIKREMPKTYEIEFSKYKHANSIIEKHKNTMGAKDWMIKLDLRKVKTYEEEGDSIQIISGEKDFPEDLKSLFTTGISGKHELNPLLIVADHCITELEKFQVLLKELTEAKCLVGTNGEKHA